MNINQIQSEERRTDSQNYVWWKCKNESKPNLLKVYERNLNWLQKSEIRKSRKRISKIKEEEKQWSFNPDLNCSKRSSSYLKNKEKMSNFIERNNNWNAKREAKREWLKEKLAIKEMSEVKSPLLNKPYQDPKVKTSCDKQKSISKRSRRMLENHKLNASNVESKSLI